MVGTTLPSAVGTIWSARTATHLLLARPSQRYTGPHPAGSVQDDERPRAHAVLSRVPEVRRRPPRYRRSKTTFVLCPDCVLPSREGGLALPDRREIG
jgi:hypothetical protein